MNKEELLASLVSSVLRDLLAGMVASGMHVSPEADRCARESYEIADALLKRSRTPGIIRAIQEGQSQ